MRIFVLSFTVMGVDGDAALPDGAAPFAEANSGDRSLMTMGGIRPNFLTPCMMVAIVSRCIQSIQWPQKEQCIAALCGPVPSAMMPIRNFDLHFGQSTSRLRRSSTLWPRMASTSEGGANMDNCNGFRLDILPIGLHCQRRCRRRACWRCWKGFGLGGGCAGLVLNQGADVASRDTYTLH
jgi:hypothetical protein